jgi:hypothetical protein
LAGASTGIRESGTYAGAFLGSFTDARESGTYAGAIPIGTPDSITDVRESGSF